MLSAQRLKDRILKDRYNSIIFEKGRGKNLYLVGGYIRDLLRGISSSDRDYILDDDIREFAREIKEITGGTLVEFTKDHMIRIAFKDGVTLDFSTPVGTIEEDLSKRDFAINTIAWSPDGGVLDPFKGIADVKNKRIRSLSRENLVADPLRMLRAYRFAAELNGSISKDTRNAIKRLHKKINNVSPERITLELFHLLNSGDPKKYLKKALSDGVLGEIFPIFYRKLERNIKAFSIIKRTFLALPSKIKVQLKKIFSQNLTYKGLLYLEVLLMQDGLHVLLKEPRVKMSNTIIKRITLTHRGVKEFEKGHSKDRLFNIFHSSENAALDILIIKDRLDLIKDLERFKKIWEKGILSSEEIINLLKVKKGPEIGKVIKELKKAEFKGEVKNKEDAIQFIGNTLHNISYRT